MTKHYLALLSLFVLAACNNQPQINLKLKAPGVNNGVIMLKQANQVVLNEAIKNGAVTLTNQLQSPGYYTLSVIDNEKPLNANAAFDVYLENADYTIETNTGSPARYPAIASSSKIQQQLSDYYRFAQSRSAKADSDVDSLLKYLSSVAGRSLPAKQLNDLKKKVRLAQTKRRALELDILKAYTAEHPDNTIGAHVMSRLYVEENPVLFNTVFQKLSADAKNSDEGVVLNNKLIRLLKLTPGGIAPEISGQTPEGAAFDRRGLKKDVILVEFWQPNSATCKVYHQKMVKGVVLTDRDKKRFGMVSIAVNAQAGNWQSEIKSDKLTWPQVLDIEGNTSPNVSNWGLKSIPAYFLVDKNWRMISANIPLWEVDAATHKYLMEHPNL